MDPTGSRDPVAQARQLDLTGDLDGARDLIRRHIRSQGMKLPIWERAGLFRAQARILRHRDDPAALRQAMDSAAHAIRLTQLPAMEGHERRRALVELEQAACLAAADRYDKALPILKRWLTDREGAVAGWAWGLRGEIHLESDERFEAVAAFQNALAEYARGKAVVRERGTRILLADALNRSGRLEEGRGVLGRELAYWNQPNSPRRIRIRYLLTLAANQHQLGHIAEALRILGQTRALLEQCPSLIRSSVLMHQQTAACLTEWGQLERAEEHLGRAAHLLDGIARPGRVVDTPRPPDWPPLASPLVAKATPPVRGALHHDLREAGAALQSLLASRRPSPDSPDRRRVAATGLFQEAERITELAQRTRERPAKSLSMKIVARVEALQGQAGAERAEVEALLRAAALLRRLGGAALLDAERLIRRALVRLELLAGMEIVQARAEIELGRILAAGSKRRQALSWVLRGLNGLHEQRFAMRRRDYRTRWLHNEISPAFALGIDLALERGLTRKASDLIVRSRTAGFVAPDAPGLDGGDPTELPLSPVSRLVDLDDMADATARTESEEHD